MAFCQRSLVVAHPAVGVEERDPRRGGSGGQRRRRAAALVPIRLLRHEDLLLQLPEEGQQQALALQHGVVGRWGRRGRAGCRGRTEEGLAAQSQGGGVGSPSG